MSCAQALGRFPYLTTLAGFESLTAARLGELTLCPNIRGLRFASRMTAELLNTILRDFPGLPESIDFFVFDAADVWQSLGLVVLSALCAVVPPPLRASSHPIAATLRAEAV